MKKHHFFATLGMLFIIVGLVVLMSPVDTAQDDVGATVPEPPEVLTGFYDMWVASPHADVTAEAFNHWNEDDPQEVPASCAQCHSTTGYQDYVGQDGSDVGSVESAQPIGQTVTCDACHSPAAIGLESVTFPSGAELANVGDATRCIVCHQGRESGLSVANDIADAGVTDMNEVNEELGFINIHYYAAAASLYGGEV
ncbi:MAG: hypothetical protein KC496_13465, partial [Anaerolineae bacterium]|nr:hypothetical protein [Anaerolineae bacterium]